MPSKRDPKPKAFRMDIQGLRAIAVGVVVLYHFWGHYLPGGFVGVDVFFVISGFLITSHLLTKPPKNFADVANFWMRRVKRLKAQEVENAKLRMLLAERDRNIDLLKEINRRSGEPTGAAGTGRLGVANAACRSGVPVGYSG